MRKYKYRKIHYHTPYFKLNSLQKKRSFDFYFKKINSCILYLVLGFCLFACYQMIAFPRIYLDGGNFVKVDYLSSYHEPGFASSYLGNDITSKVKVHGEVDTSIVGEYPITYQVSSHGFSTIKTRVVKVVDSKKPKIEFTTNTKKLYICPDTKYLFDDYKATDDYDGDVTEYVKVKQVGKKMRYEVTDSSGNKAVVFRKILYQDIEGPTLTLEASNPLILTVGDTFHDSTYQVRDNCSSDIKVKIRGNVDTNKPGEYERKYIAKDDAGNCTTVIQKVIVFEPSRKGVIYLTFDDGPRSGTTDKILDTLKEKGVKATFFVTSGGPDDLIKRAYLEGHSIGLHTASHDYSVIYSSSDSYFDDLQLVSDRVEQITGERSYLLRFPGGSSNTVSRHYSSGIMSYLTSEVVQRGYRYYDWNIDSRDAEGGKFSADEISNFVISQLSHDRVNMVLMHDTKVTTMDALGKIIDYGKEHGYTFDRITPTTDMVTQRVNN